MADSQSSLTTTTCGSLWTREQDKDFENALNVVDEETPDRWERIAAMVAGKDAAEVKRHYDILQEDVLLIDSGRVAVPNYSLSSLSLSNGDSPTSDSKKGGATIPASAAPAGNNGNGAPARTVSSRSADQERRKGIPWSEDEHRLFLQGLEKFGKGDWRSISRNFVISRTPTQVASHAQKYFIRMSNSTKDNKRRSSIHDITTVNNGDAAQQGPRGPITGQPPPGAPVPSMQAGMYPPAMGAPMMMPPGYGPPRPAMRIPMAYPMAQPGMHH